MKPTTASLCCASKQNHCVCKFKPLVRPPPVDEGGVGIAVPLSEKSGVHAIMAEALPRYVILQSNSNNKYLRLVAGNTDVPLALKFGGDYSFDRDTRFELVRSTQADGKVHIRCMYNNRYLAVQGPANNWITAVAAEPVENETDWSCTLFEPKFDTAGDVAVVRFLHVATDNYACLKKDDSFGLDDCIKADKKEYDQNGRDQCIVINWESVVMFPNRIVIKGDNNKYLLTRNDTFLSFWMSALQGRDTEFEVTPSRNGGIRIKCLSNDKFWRKDDGFWVGADGSDEKNHNTVNVFLPVKLAENLVAIRSLRDNLYLKRLSYSGEDDTLAGLNKYIDEYSRLKIEDPVLSRTIDNVVFRLPAAKVSKGKPVVLINKEVTNNSQSEMTVAMDLSFTDIHSSTWMASQSLKLGVTATISSGVPELVEGSIEISTEFSSSYEWGETVETERRMGSVYTVTVPKRTIVRASLLAVKGTAGIPFSYLQTDILSDGTTKTYEKDDGWYTGANSYDENFKVEQFPIPTAKL